MHSGLGSATAGARSARLAPVPRAVPHAGPSTWIKSRRRAGSRCCAPCRQPGSRRLVALNLLGVERVFLRQGASNTRALLEAPVVGLDRGPFLEVHWGCDLPV